MQMMVQGQGMKAMTQTFEANHGSISYMSPYNPRIYSKIPGIIDNRNNPQGPSGLYNSLGLPGGCPSECFPGRINGSIK